MIEIRNVPRSSVGAPLSAVMAAEGRLLLAHPVAATDPSWDDPGSAHGGRHHRRRDRRATGGSVFECAAAVVAATLARVTARALWASLY